MPKARTFSAEFKAPLVLEVLSGAKTSTEVCRHYQIHPSLFARWRSTFLEQAPSIFQQEQNHAAEQARIADLEPMTGRLTMELEVAKKSLQLARLTPEQKRVVARSLVETGYLVSLVCDVLDYPRSSFYYKAPLDLGEQQLRAAVQRLAEEWPTYGYRRITAMLECEGQAVSSKQVRHHAADLGLAAAPAKRKVRTTNSQHCFGRYPTWSVMEPSIRPTRACEPLHQACGCVMAKRDGRETQAAARRGTCRSSSGSARPLGLAAEAQARAAAGGRLAGVHVAALIQAVRAYALRLDAARGAPR